jgi:hypothetical protein
MANFTTLTAITLKENGWKIKPTGSGFINTVMVQYIKETGSKTFSMATGLRLGLITRTLLAITTKEISTVKDGMNGQMVATTMGSGQTI